MAALSYSIASLNNLGGVRELKVNGHDAVTAIELSSDAEKTFGDKDDTAWVKTQGLPSIKLRVKADKLEKVWEGLKDRGLVFTPYTPTPYADGIIELRDERDLENALNMLGFDQANIRSIVSAATQATALYGQYSANLGPLDISELQSISPLPRGSTYESKPEEIAKASFLPVVTDGGQPCAVKEQPWLTKVQAGLQKIVTRG